MKRFLFGAAGALVGLACTTAKTDVPLPVITVEPKTMELSISADAKVEQYDLYVQDDATKEIVTHTGFVAVERDLTRDQLKIALKLASGGRFTFLMVGVIGDVANGKPAPGATHLFWADHVAGGTTSAAARLITVPAGDDADRDLWPSARKFMHDSPEANSEYASRMDLLDCADDAAAVSPFDSDTCADLDKDGDPSTTDCDDNDPKRHHATAADPFPDPPNCCGYSLGKKGSADENRDFTGTALCPLRRCGDGIDESCSGNADACVVDEDCDGVSPPLDCDDHNPAIHGGCVPCDLDGDGFERDDAPNGCPDHEDKHPGKIDCNDYDAAVNPGATLAIGGTEVGLGNFGRITSSARGYCRRVYESTGVSGTAKISSLGWSVGDTDCNGKAYEGCPSVACDVDGDGWPNDTPECIPADKLVDRDDNDPTVFPGSATSCATGGAPGCQVDLDGDGYGPAVDCDDRDPSTHPFAPELCDGEDNDCDGLIDEGNPDTNGAPMVTSGAVTSCTDSDVGECAKTRGVCVCSAAVPMSTTNPASRTICPTEDSASSKPPRCFGAGQPKSQTDCK